MSDIDVEKKPGLYQSNEISEGEVIEAINAHDDNQLLAQIGYKPELKRYFSTLQVFGVAFSIMGLLPSIASVLGTALSGGSVGMIWGWACASVFIFLIGVSMAELGSAIPTSGGLYYWTYHYSPPSIKVPLSFLIGNSNSVALIGALCSVDYGLSNMVLAAVKLGDSTFEITNAKVYGVFVATVVSHICVCSVASAFVSRLQTVSIISNLGLIVLFFIAVPIGKSQRGGFNDAKYIFGDLENLSDWPNGWEFMLCWMPAIWTIGAFDSCVHMSEEAKNASKSVPIGILGSISACGIIGFFIMIVIGACVSKDIASVVGTDLGQPMVQFILDCLGKKWALAFTALMIICQWLMGASILVAISRQIWSFARDHGLPFSRIIRVVNKKWSVPIRSVIFGGVVGIIMGLLCLIGSTAANALFSLYVAGNYFAWGMPIFCRMVWARDTFVPGPFFTGKFSPFINWVTIFYIIFVIFLAMFPSNKSVDKETMNYTVVINVGVWILSMCYYAIYARKHYNGPRKTIDDTVSPGTSTPVQDELSAEKSAEKSVEKSVEK